jgi:predicted glycogen debranching enzyme
VASNAAIQFGREICGNLDAAESREWLVTNGIGGYASGTVAGTGTRRYHGLLIAALQPPVGRMQLVASLDETVHSAGSDFILATHRWASGAVDPQGFCNIESFHLEGTKPVWTFAFGSARLEKRVWMRHGENTTYVQYELLSGNGSVELDLKAMVNYRDYHSSTHARDWQFKLEPIEHGIKITAFDGAVPFFLRCAEASCEVRGEWYRDCYLPAEAARGLDDREDHLFAALFHVKLAVGDAVTFVLSVREDESLDPEPARSELAGHEVKLLNAWEQANPAREAAKNDSPPWLRQLVYAADQFIVKRSLPDQPDGCTIIAGYPWFADWGRDTMIALPGLTLVTGRTDVARQILLAFARVVDGGMLPNNFPDSGGKPEYNTVDASLWYFEAIRQYYEATQDAVTLQALYPVLASIIDSHIKGTRYNIHADPTDGLLYAGGPGVQLTWMDAKIGDWVVTPRTGKPVEINALWINALETLADFAQLFAKPFERYAKLATQARKGFQKFWNPERNCCFDVIDAPGFGSDPSLRPNQIFTVSLPVSPLSPQQQKSVVDVCAEHLLTPYGLRSLAPGAPGYQGYYTGGPRDRDAAYHQGTVWGWLLGPFVQAHLRVYRDRAAATRSLEPLANHIREYGLGTLGEVFDGNAPFASRGCIAQAWTVAEVLRAWHSIRKA